MYEDTPVSINFRKLTNIQLKSILCFYANNVRKNYIEGTVSEEIRDSCVRELGFRKIKNDIF